MSMIPKFHPGSYWNKLLPVLFFCIAIQVHAQRNLWQAKIDSIKADGFYKIHLTPDIISKLQPSFCDLRIMNQQNKEVPYIFKNEKPVTFTDLFREYSIKSIEKSPKQTTLLLENPDKKKIDNIALVIKNADVTKSLRLSGSDDENDWYIIKDNYFITDVFDNKATSTIKIVDFPLSDYLHFKIEISDSLTPPVKILKAGYYDSFTEDAKYTDVPSPFISQKDSTESKETYLKMTFDEPQLIDKIYFKVEGPRYYMRNCSLGTMTVQKLTNGNTKMYFFPFQEFTLSSNGYNTVYTSGNKSKELWLKIYNEDNPPLKITGVKVSQITRNVIAYLQKNQLYTLQFGNEKANIPSYDLVNFTDSISKVNLVSTGKIDSISYVPSLKANTPASIFANKITMWIVLIFVLGLLGLMSFRMIKDLNKK